MSDYQIDVNRLKKDELQYELRIRGLEASDKPVAELRTTLRPLLRMESLNQSLSYPKFELDVAHELQIIASKLAEIKVTFQEFARDPAKIKDKRTIRTRLTHLMKRTDRLPSDTLAEEEHKQKSELLMEILGKFDTLESLAKKTTGEEESVNLSRGLIGRVTIDSDDSSADDEPPHNLTAVQANVRVRQLPVYKWNLKFSGDAKGLTVHNFLERVDELRKARGLTVENLYDQALDLFDGKALIWFRANRHRCSDWKSLTTLLVQHYEPPDYKSRLFKEILARTQHTSETIVEYLSCMAGMFNRYGNISEDIQVDIVSRNLSPFYAMQLPAVHSLRELERECRELEVRKYRAEHYVAPSHSKHDSVEPNFAYLPRTSSTSVSEVSAVGTSENPEIAIMRAEITCWNCRKTGHLSRNCGEALRIRCFGCGKQGVTRRNCHECRSGTSQSGNAK